MKGRTTWDEPVEEMHADLDAYLGTYSRYRAHGGNGKNAASDLQGRNPEAPEPEEVNEEEVKTTGLKRWFRARPGVR